MFAWERPIVNDTKDINTTIQHVAPTDVAPAHTVDKTGNGETLSSALIPAVEPNENAMKAQHLVPFENNARGEPARFQRQLDRVEKFVIDMARELRQGQLDSTRRYNHRIESIESQLSSQELRLTRLNDTTESEQDSNQRILARIEKRLSALEQDINTTKSRNERNSRAVEELSDSVKSSIDHAMKASNEQEQASLQRKNTEQSLLLKRFEAIEAATLQVRNMCTQRIDELREYVEMRLRDVTESLKKEIEQRSAFESGFRRFIRRFQDEVRELILKLQDNTKESHEYLRGVLQAEVRKRMDGEAKVAKDASQAVQAVQGSIFDLTRQLQAQFRYSQDSSSKLEHKLSDRFEKLRLETADQVVEVGRSCSKISKDIDARSAEHASENLKTIQTFKQDIEKKMETLTVQLEQLSTLYQSLCRRASPAQIPMTPAEIQALSMISPTNEADERIVKQFDEEIKQLSLQMQKPAGSTSRSISPTRASSTRPSDDGNDKYEDSFHGDENGHETDDYADAFESDVDTARSIRAESPQREEQEGMGIGIGIVREDESETFDEPIGESGEADQETQPTTTEEPTDPKTQPSATEDAEDSKAALGTDEHLQEVQEGEGEIQQSDSKENAEKGETEDEGPEDVDKKEDVEAEAADEEPEIDNAEKDPLVITGGDLSVYDINSGRVSPIPLAIGVSQVAFVTAGAHHAACITVSGSLFTWGANDQCQLGLGEGASSEPREEPTLVSINGFVVSVACSNAHTLAATNNGVAYSWGSALMGRLGHERDIDRASPTRVQMAAGVCIESVAAGQFNSGFLDSNGQLWICGAGDSGQIGDNDCEPCLVPKKCNQASYKFSSMSFGDRHVAAVTDTGILMTWGSSEFGCLGYMVDETEDVNECQREPRPVDFFHNHPVCQKVCCGERHTTVLLEDSSVWSFGSGETHQIGVFDNVDQLVPVRVKHLDSMDWKVLDLDVGNAASMCVTNKGDTFAWGYAIESPIPKLVKPLQSVFAMQASVGSVDSVFVKTGIKQRVYSLDLFDDIVEDDSGNSVLKGIESESLAGYRLTNISAGNAHVAAINAAGSILVWDSDDMSLLGLGERPAQGFVQKPLTLPVSFHQHFTSIACGYEHTLALREDGCVYSWGNALMGRLGHGPDIDQSEPKLIEALGGEATNSVVAISCGQFNSGAVLDDGSAYIWGAGRAGQIGNGLDEPQMLPAKVSFFEENSMRVRDIAFGDEHVIAVTDKGVVYSWGDNESGQLARVVSEDDSSASAMLTGMVAGLSQHTIVEIRCGERMSLVLSEKGRIFSWGDGDTTQLGLGDDENRISPTMIDSLSDRVILHIDVGPLHCAAVTNDGVAYAWGFELSASPVRVSIPQNTDEDEATRLAFACCTSEHLIMATDANS